MKGGEEIQPSIPARPPWVSKLSASWHRRTKRLRDRITYDNKKIAQRESEIEELQDEALDLYSQARDDHHVCQKIEEQVVVLKVANDCITNLLKD